MDGSMWRGSGVKWAVAVVAVLVLAIVAGRLVLGGDREYQMKPATGSAQAMAAASDRSSSSSPRP